MPRTIDEGFRDFLKRLTPFATESEAAKRHRASIEDCLDDKFNLQRFFRSGSFGNGTSVAGYSDVDYFASMADDMMSENSQRALVKVARALGRRFPDTGVKVKCPAVVVPFGLKGKETTEVVPAGCVGKTEDGDEVYDIANCKGGWRRSSPEAHKGYVQNTDERLSNKARPLIRFIKAWKFYRGVPVSSFYLELAVTMYLANETSIIYDVDIARFFEQLNEFEVQPIVDPLGISGRILPCAYALHHGFIKNGVKRAAARAKLARTAEQNENTKLAFRHWNILYSSKFPSYYK